MMHQIAPYPRALQEACRELRYLPGWQFELVDEDRGQGCVGLTLNIYPNKPDSQPPGTLITLADYGRGRFAVHRVVPIEAVRAGDRAVSLRNGRLNWVRGGVRVNSTSEHPFHGDLVAVKAGGQLTRYTPNHRCMVYAGDAFRDRFVVYLMARGASFRVGRARGMTGAGSSRRKLGLMGRGFTEGADRIWVLGIYDDEGAAAVAEASFSWRFGVPTMTFRASNHPGALTQARVDDFWLSVGHLQEAGTSVLAEVGKDVRFPFWTYGAGRGTHRGLGVRYLTEVRACNVETGMEMVPFDGDGLAPVRIEVGRERYDGPVFSLGVGPSDDGLYVADGLLTHNSYHPERHVGTRFLYPVPAASYNRESWEEWIWARIEETEGHERAEWFRFGDEERRPFKPAHSDGWDPGVVRSVVSETVTNTPNAGRLVTVPCTCGHRHPARMGERFAVEQVYHCDDADCACSLTSS